MAIVQMKLHIKQVRPLGSLVNSPGAPYPILADLLYTKLGPELSMSTMKFGSEEKEEERKQVVKKFFAFIMQGNPKGALTLCAAAGSTIRTL
jgi:hypothetical protein